MSKKARRRLEMQHMNESSAKTVDSVRDPAENDDDSDSDNNNDNNDGNKCKNENESDGGEVRKGELRRERLSRDEMRKLYKQLDGRKSRSKNSKFGYARRCGLDKGGWSGAEVEVGSC